MVARDESGKVLWIWRSSINDVGSGDGWNLSRGVGDEVS